MNAEDIKNAVVALKDKSEKGVFEKFMNDHFNVNNCNLLYQYTSMEALFNGIIVKNEHIVVGNEICLWASKSVYMNDPTEIKSGNDFIIKSLEPLGFNPSDKTKELHTTSDTTYISSFSNAIDNLPMWGIYGKNGTGVALGFDCKSLLNIHKDRLFRCLYINDIIKDEITELFRNHAQILNGIKEINKVTTEKDDYFKGVVGLMNSRLVLFLARMLFFSKNQSYQYEQEVRLSFSIKEDSDKIKYRHQNGLIIPYIENYFPKDILKEIYIGPNNEMERTKKSLRVYLDHMGFEHVVIKESAVPYRG